ncbi:MAG: hypothetical protein QOF33_894 [Thermomicrobiales bacterium]|jgi:glycosyltransferase involved in cell wall biosynthesis|nr:hypothetical protein [Thermomicrobiales bacterium]
MRVVITRRFALDVPDGINIFIFSLSQELLEMGNEVTVVANTVSSKDKVREFYKMSRYPESIALSERSHFNHEAGRMLATWYLKGRKVVDDARPDLVIVNGALPFTFRATTCTVSHDLEPHGGRIGFVRPLYKGLSYRRSDRIVATCTEVRDGLSKELRVDSSLIDVIPTCIDTKAYENEEFDARENAILHMGTVGYKNPIATIKAFARVRSDCTLYITGRMEEYIEDFIRGLPQSIRDRIEFLGYASAERLKRLLGTVKIVSVPSQYVVPVASPTVLEAFASGTPVVASRSISRDILRHDDNGFVCQAEDEQEMSRRFELLLDDAGRWKAMSLNASRTAEYFSARRVAERYLELA